MVITGILSAILVLSCLPAPLLDFGIPKWKADQNVRIEDAYKWIYQATRGGEHAAPDLEMAREWLDEEWKSLGKPDKNEKLWEPLCRDGSIGRLDLRIYKFEGGKEEDILDAFVTSSREYKEVGSGFAETWSMLGKRLRKHRTGKLTYSEWSRLDVAMRKKNYPAIHHSKEFEKAYHPAYRVITASQRRKLKPR